MKLSRKDFLKSALVVVGAGVGLAQTVVGCGPSTGTNPGSGGSSGSGGSGSGSGGSGSGGTESGSGGSGSGGSESGGKGGNANGGHTNGGTSGGGGSSGANACATHMPAITIGTNHAAPMEHILMLPAADITAGATKMYSIKGNSTHDHMITITAAQFTTLKSGMTYMMTSTTGGGHTHAVTIVCA